MRAGNSIHRAFAAIALIVSTAGNAAADFVFSVNTETGALLLTNQSSSSVTLSSFSVTAFDETLTPIAVFRTAPWFSFSDQMLGTNCGGPGILWTEFDNNPAPQISSVLRERIYDFTDGPPFPANCFSTIGAGATINLGNPLDLSLAGLNLAAANLSTGQAVNGLFLNGQSVLFDVALTSQADPTLQTATVFVDGALQPPITAVPESATMIRGAAIAALGIFLGRYAMTARRDSIARC